MILIYALLSEEVITSKSKAVDTRSHYYLEDAQAKLIWTWEQFLAGRSSQHGNLHEGGRVHDLWCQTLLAIFQLITEIQSPVNTEYLPEGQRRSCLHSFLLNIQNYCVSIQSNPLVSYYIWNMDIYKGGRRKEPEDKKITKSRGHIKVLV